jgi:uncharacterized protein
LIADTQAWVEELSQSTWPFVVVSAVFVAPFGEELVFRRVLLRAWTNSWIGFSGAAFLSSGLWAVIHFYSTPLTVVLFIEGLILCWLARRLRSIWPGIAFHMVNNLWATIQGLAQV